MTVVSTEMGRRVCVRAETKVFFYLVCCNYIYNIYIYIYIYYFFFSTDVISDLVINPSHTYNENGLEITAMWQVRLVEKGYLTIQ